VVVAYVGQSDTQTSSSPNPYVSQPKPAPDPAGGTSTDYFFSLDIINRISLHVECGSPLFEDFDKNLRVKLVTGLMFGLLKHLVGLTGSNTTASLETGFWRGDFAKEQAADWARTVYP